MSIQRKAVGSLATLTAVMALPACSGGPSASDADNGNGNGRVTVAVDSLPTTLDPGQNFSAAQYSIVKLVGGTLTELDASGQNVEMGLADSVEGDDSEYVVKLKPDLKFSDGSELTADDVAASFEYYLADESNGYSYSFTPIKEVTATDDLTVTFELKSPYPSLPIVLALPQTSILPSEAIESRGDKLYEGDPMPTAGEFQVASLTKNEVALEANPNYAGTEPTTQSLNFKRIPDPSARITQLRGGEIDFADNLPPKLVSQLSGDITSKFTSAPIGATYLLMNNRDNSLLSDVRIRQALALAVDRNQINDVAWAGQAEVALGVFGSRSQWNDDFLSADADPEGAKEMLAGTECETGCTLKLLGDSSDPSPMDAGLVVQQNLQAIGIEVDIENVDGAAQTERLGEGDFDIAVRASYDVADFPDGYIEYVLGPVIKALRSGYVSEEMYQAIDEVVSATGSDRVAAVDRLTELFKQDMPMAPLVDFGFVSASRVAPELFSVDQGFFYRVG